MRRMVADGITRGKGRTVPRPCQHSQPRGNNARDQPVRYLSGCHCRARGPSWRGPHDGGLPPRHAARRLRQHAPAPRHHAVQRVAAPQSRPPGADAGAARALRDDRGHQRGGHVRARPRGRGVRPVVASAGGVPRCSPPPAGRPRHRGRGRAEPLPRARGHPLAGFGLRAVRAVQEPRAPGLLRRARPGLRPGRPRPPAPLRDDAPPRRADGPAHRAPPRPARRAPRDQRLLLARAEPARDSLHRAAQHRLRERAERGPVHRRLRVPVRPLRPERARLPARGPALRAAHGPARAAAGLRAEPRGQPGRRRPAPPGERALDAAPRVVRAPLRDPARLPGVRPAGDPGRRGRRPGRHHRPGLARLLPMGAHLLALPGHRARPGRTRPHRHPRRRPLLPEGPRPLRGGAGPFGGAASHRLLLRAAVPAARDAGPGGHPGRGHRQRRGGGAARGGGARGRDRDRSRHPAPRQALPSGAALRRPARARHRQRRPHLPAHHARDLRPHRVRPARLAHAAEPRLQRAPGVVRVHGGRDPRGARPAQGRRPAQPVFRGGVEGDRPQDLHDDDGGLRRPAAPVPARRLRRVGDLPSEEERGG